MKCVQLMESWFQGPAVTGLESKYQLHLNYGVDLLNTLPLKFSVANCEDKMENQVPQVEETYFPLSCDMRWRSLPKLTPTQSPAWGHLKVELDLQAMMEEDPVPKCRRDLYLAFTQCAAQEACNIGDHHPESSRVPCDGDSLYEEPTDLVSPSVPKPEDRNLARLIAKFDSSIEALWNPDDVSEMVEDLRDDYNDDHMTASPISMDIHGSKQNLFIACGTNITSSIWSSRPSPEEPLRDEWSVPPNVKWSEGETNPCFDSLVALNHNREDSSFTEVIPRSFHTNHEVQPSAPAPQPPPAVPSDSSKEEEEDLLTSARTHFIPIRQDPAPRQQQHQSTNYADGTTFAIPTSLDQIIYTRSESGALYIEDEACMDLPPKYMEYKSKEIQKDNEANTEELMDFVPKFRVSQNEKCCQTEQEDPCIVKTSDSNTQPSVEDFFFPGDEQLSLETEEEEICQAMTGEMSEKSSGPVWIPGWPSHQHEKRVSPQSWYRIWSDGSGCWDCSRPSESHKSQLRQELSEDGEQLLSDLSSLLDQYGGVLSEINGNKCDHSEKMAEYTVNYKIVKTGPLSNSGTAQKERKRRYSSSQRVCSLFLEGSCRRPHCRFSHDMASIPCHFWADASCLKGGRCPFLHGGRPVTL